MLRPEVYYSNRLEQLLLFLAERQGQSPQGPFARRILVVPSESMKHWVYLGLASHSAKGLAFGWEVLHLSQALQRWGASGYVPSHSELAFGIEGILRREIARESQDSLWQPVKQYLRSSRREQRLVSLSERLAELFFQYSQYGGEAFLVWSQEKPRVWQQALWQELFGAKSPWEDPFQCIRELPKRLNKLPSSLELHLFGFSFIPEALCQALSSIASKRPLAFYLLSPCQAFWSDIRSDREAVRLQDYWRWQGASEQQRCELEEYLTDRNPLLANFGRLGREMAQFVEDCDCETTELYHLAAGLEESEHYLELLDGRSVQGDSSHHLDLLSAVQSDMLLLRTPSSAEKQDFGLDDDSIQVHIYSSRYRELQGLKDQILALMDRHGYVPSDFLVMAANIADYTPYIDAVFGTRNTQIPYSLIEVPVLSRSPLIQGFLHLLSLSRSRWDFPSLMQLFEHPHFRLCQQITDEELSTWRSWLRDGHFRWGENAEHRAQLMQQAHCNTGHTELPETGTWSFAYQQLLDQLLEGDDEEDFGQNYRRTVDMSQGDSLAKLWSLFHSLRSDLQQLQDEHERPLSEWVDYLHCLLEAYFQVDPDDQDAVADLNRLRSEFQRLAKASSVLADDALPFHSLEGRLIQALSGETLSRGDKQLNAVRFCSLLPMRAIPAKVIVFLGMDDSSFPRQEKGQTLNLMREWKECSYCPSRADFDRYLFLEALLAARRHFIVSYQVGGDDKERPPSLLLAELLSYLDNYYTLEQQKPSQELVKRHPFHCFSADYFSSGSHAPRSYDQRAYGMARALCQGKKLPAHRFLGTCHRIESKSEDFSQLAIGDLSRAARNPLQLYFRDRLELSLKDLSETITEDEDSFHLSALQRAQLKRAALFSSSNYVLEQADKQGTLPIGLFGQAAKQQVTEEFSELRRSLAQWGVASGTPFHTVHLGGHCQQVRQRSEYSWECPALKIGEIQLVGSLKLLSPSGMMAWGGKAPEDVLRVWPEFLVFASIATQLPFVEDLQLLMLKSGSKMPELWEDPKVLLKSYLQFYQECLTQPCPLIPEWIPSFMRREEAFMKSQVREQWEGQWKLFYNHYARWALDSIETLSLETLLDPWSDLAEANFGKLIAQWFPKAARRTQHA